MALKVSPLATASRGAGREGSARARRAGESDLNTGLRLGDGVEVVSGEMKVPLGSGLEIDRSGNVSSTAIHGIVVIKAAEMALTETYAPLVLSAPLYAVNSAGITVDTDDHQIYFASGGLYLCEVGISMVWDQGVSVGGPSSRVYIDKTDTGASPSTVVIYPVVSLKHEGDGQRSWPGRGAVLTSVIDLRSESAGCFIRVMVSKSNTDGVAMYASHTNIKIERIG